jgi:GNAT superfamily N-acetyltransferase
MKLFPFILLSLALNGVESSQPQFRTAAIEDLQEILSLDREISYEHFKPIFLCYSECPLGQEADKILEDELDADRIGFQEAILGLCPNKLYIVCMRNKIVGFSYLNQIEQSLTIDLLCIDKKYRHQGIGKKFFEYILDQNPVTECRVACLNKDYGAIQFWKSLGFKKLSIKPSDIGNEFQEDHPECYEYYQFSINEQVICKAN